MITCVVSIRNRPRELAENFLTSVREQSECDKLIVVSYGSDNLDWEKELFGEHLVVAGNPDSEFNISHANNIGIRMAKTKWVVTCGIDMIFAPNLFTSYLDVVENDSEAIVGCSPTYLDKEGERVREARRPCCLCFNRHWLNTVRGYDESYRGWGFEDEDIRNRAYQSGYHLIDTRQYSYILHQYHALNRDEKLAQANRTYFYRPNKPLIRNPRSWGDN